MRNFSQPIFCTDPQIIKKHIDVFKVQGVMCVDVFPQFQRNGRSANQRLQMLEVTITAREGSGDIIRFLIAHESGCSIPFVVESYLYNFGLRPTWLWTSHSDGRYDGQFSRQGTMKEVSNSRALEFPEIL